MFKKFVGLFAGILIAVSASSTLAYTNTPNYNFILPGVNDPVDADLWGDYLNDNFSSIDTLLATFPSPTLASAHIYVGNGSNVPVSVAVSGDLTLANTGAFTIAANAVSLSKLATQATNTVLANATGSTAVPTAVSMGASTVLCRASTGDITACTLSGLTAVSGVLTATPGAFTTTFTSSDQSITFGTAVTLAHGLAGVPKIVNLYMVCQSADVQYSAGDVIQVAPSNDSNNGLGWYSDATNITYRFSSAGFQYVSKTSGGTGGLTAAKWKVRVIAYY